MRSRHRGPVVPDFCSSIPPAGCGESNVEVINQLLEQVKCIVSKQPIVPCSEDEEEEIREEYDYEEDVQELEEENEEMRAEIERLGNELNETLESLEDEIERSNQLEECVANLKRDINDIDQELCLVTAHRDQLLSQIDDLNRKLENLQDSYDDLQEERDELFEECRANQDALRRHGGLQNDLQNGLADSCSQIDDLSSTIGCLNAEINRLKREMEDLEDERTRLARQLEDLKFKCQNQNRINEEIIKKLKEEIKCLKGQLAIASQKFDDALAAHQKELDRLDRERAKLEALLEEERRRREELEKKLKDCEEQKKKNNGGGGSGGSGGGGPGPNGGGGRGRPFLGRYQNKFSEQSNSNNCEEPHSQCDQYEVDVRKLEQEKANLQNCSKEMEQKLLNVTTQNFEISQRLVELQDKLLSFENAKKEHDENNNRIFNQQLSDATSSKEALELQLFNLEQHLRKVTKSSEEKGEEVNELRAKLSHLEYESSSKTEQLYEELTQLQTRISIVEEERNSFLNEMQYYQQEMENMRQRAQSESLQLHEELNNARSQIIYLQHEQQQQSKTEDDEEGRGRPIQEEIIQDQIEEISCNYQQKIEELKQAHKKELQRRENEFLLKSQNKMPEFRDFAQNTEDTNGNLVEPPETTPTSLLLEEKDAALVELVNAKRALKHDVKKLKKLVNERDDHIASLQTAINELRKKYSDHYKAIKLKTVEVEGQLSVIQCQEEQLQAERENINRDIEQLRQEQQMFETEKQKQAELIRQSEKQRTNLQYLGKMKEKIESEVTVLKEAISKNFVDKSEVDQLKANYEVQIADLTNKFEDQLEMNRQLAEINEYLGKQFKDRDILYQIRDSNEELLRKELKAVITSAQSDKEKLQRIISEREEEVASLRQMMELLKNRYVSEAQKNQELTKQVQILASSSTEDVNDVINQNNWML